MTTQRFKNVLDSIATLSKKFTDIANREKNIMELYSIREEQERKANEEKRKLDEIDRIFDRLATGTHYQDLTPQATPQKVIPNPYISASMPSSVVTTPVVSTPDVSTPVVSAPVVSTPVVSAPVVSTHVVFENNPFKPPALSRFNIPSLKSPSQA